MGKIITIGKHFEFEASHILPGELYGKCANLHGHTYKLIVEVSGNVNSDGWLVNFSEIKRIVNEFVIKRFDHSHLNTYIEIPTAENILLWIDKSVKDKIQSLGVSLKSLTLYETSNSFARLTYQ